MKQTQSELVLGSLNVMNRYEKAKKDILDFLKLSLPDTLYYHSYNHVLDVLGAADLIAENEGVGQHDLELLRIAVLYHDSGYTVDSKDHEKLSCEIAHSRLPSLGYSYPEIEKICRIVMATKYPHSPNSHLEEIICDADLDYLGRDDFFEIGNTLLHELNESGRFKTEKDWNHFQEKFLSSHKYFTETAKNLRREKKLMHLEKIRESLKD